MTQKLTTKLRQDKADEDELNRIIKEQEEQKKRDNERTKD
jgi:hypothetical protein